MLKRIAMLLSCAFVLSVSLNAATERNPPEVIGPLWPIAEEDMLATITDRVNSPEAARLVRARMEEARARVVHRLETPDPVPGIATAQRTRSFTFDPSVLLTSDILDPEGRLLVAAGTTYNPLDRVQWNGMLLFINGADPDQVSFAETQIADVSLAKVVLVGGSPLDLMRRWQRPVYFDQDGLLSARLGIAEVPAVVSRNGRLLEIAVIAPDEENGRR